MSEQHNNKNHDDNRREFIRGSSLLLASALPASHAARRAGSGLHGIRVGLIGCGGSGVQVAASALRDRRTHVQVVALADAFPDRIQQAARTLKGRGGEQFLVNEETRFAGPDAYRRLLDVELDAVILAAPTFLRGSHLRTAVEKGIHAYLLQPTAMDARGVCDLIQAGKLAGTQRTNVAISNSLRPTKKMLDAIELIKQGVIGEVLQIHFQTIERIPPLPSRPKRVSDAEYEVRNWKRFAELGGSAAFQRLVPDVELTRLLIDSCPSRVVGQAGDTQSRVEFSFETGQSSTSTWTRTTDTHPPRRLIEVIGSHGTCELVTGKFLDLNRAVLRPDFETLPAAQNRLEQFLTSIEQKTCINDCPEAALAIRLALMGELCMLTGRPQMWQDVSLGPLFA